jgi:acyl dehydratase
MTHLSCSNIEEHIGREIGVSDWLTIEQSRVDMFAEATGDHQWIHVDVERAKRESPFRTPVAHGYLSLALVAALSMEAGAIPADADAAMNYGLDKVRFLAPVAVGSRVRLRVTLLGVERKAAGQLVMKTSNVLEIEGSEKPALVAETLAFIVAGRGSIVR